MTTTPKRCPFCKAEPKTHTFCDSATPSVSCQTKGCVLGGGNWYPLSKWNTRAAPMSEAELEVELLRASITTLRGYYVTVEEAMNVAKKYRGES